MKKGINFKICKIKIFSMKRIPELQIHFLPLGINHNFTPDSKFRLKNNSLIKQTQKFIPYKYFRSNLIQWKTIFIDFLKRNMITLYLLWFFFLLCWFKFQNKVISFHSSRHRIASSIVFRLFVSNGFIVFFFKKNSSQFFVYLCVVKDWNST